MGNGGIYIPVANRLANSMVHLSRVMELSANDIGYHGHTAPVFDYCRCASQDTYRHAATIISSWTFCAVLEVSAMCGAKYTVPLQWGDCHIYTDCDECSETMALGITLT